MNYQTIIVTTDTTHAEILINRESKLNALNQQTFSELSSAMDAILKDKTIRGIIITGSGKKAFAAGADIAELSKASPDEAFQISLKGQRLFQKISEMPIPVLAAVNGFALGGGCELAMACHFRYASQNAVFGQPEVNLGLIPGYAGTQRLPRLVGKGFALELLLTGDTISAEKAFQIGLVNNVLEPSELLDSARKTMSKIASKAPLAIKYCIHSVQAGEQMALEDAAKLEASCFGLVHASDDAKEGCNTFLNKKKPSFKGF